MTISSDEPCVGERSNFENFPTHTQDHGDDIATRGKSVRPRTLVDRKRKRSKNGDEEVVLDVIQIIGDPSTERTAPPCSTHVRSE